MAQLAKLVVSAWEARNGCFKVLQIYMHIAMRKYDLCTTMLITTAAWRHIRGKMTCIYTRRS